MLSNYTRKDSGVKDYMCFECGKTFIAADKLKQHQIIHSAEKPSSCSQCDKRFSQSEHLKTHEMIHNGDKPHTCDQCGKRFTQKGGHKQPRLIGNTCLYVHFCKTEKKRTYMFDSLQFPVEMITRGRKTQ